MIKHEDAVVCDTPAEMAFVKSVKLLVDAMDCEWQEKIVRLKKLYGVSQLVRRVSSISFVEEKDASYKKEDSDVILANKE